MVTDFVLEVLTAPVVRNEPFQMKVTAVNQLGQKVTSYTGSVQVSVQYATILPPVYTFTAADAGAHVHPRHVPRRAGHRPRAGPGEHDHRPVAVHHRHLS